MTSVSTDQTSYIQFTGHPSARPIGSFTGLLSDQSDQFQKAIASMRAFTKSWEEGYRELPTVVDLVMDDGTRIVSQPDNVSSGASEETGDVRLLLCKWDGNELIWCVVDIGGNRIDVNAWRNQPDPTQAWRKKDPTIIPPT